MFGEYRQLVAPERRAAGNGLDEDEWFAVFRPTREHVCFAKPGLDVPGFERHLNLLEKCVVPFLDGGVAFFGFIER